eukprot:9473372-Pyramimonas_sp.AAC.1
MGAFSSTPFWTWHLSSLPALSLGPLPASSFAQPRTFWVCILMLAAGSLVGPERRVAPAPVFPPLPRRPRIRVEGEGRG